MHTIGSPLAWVVFLGLVLVILAIDLTAHPSDRALTAGEAAGWSAAWIALGLAFGVGIWVVSGRRAGLEYLTGYLVEQALSVDNIFVFLLLFTFFRVPDRLRHRVLYWGVLGAMGLRAIFIFAGVALASRFEWVFYGFGVILLWSGGKLLFGSEEESVDPEHSLVMRTFRRVVPMTEGYRERRFVVREAGRVLATPLLLVLVMVEVTDVLFAVDSIPAVFGVTRDPFIVFTSNIFAVVGLRALFGVLQGLLDRLRFLEKGLGVILVFVAVKMFLEEVWPAPPEASLAVIGGVLAVSVAASLLFPDHAGPEADGDGAGDGGAADGVGEADAAAGDGAGEADAAGEADGAAGEDRATGARP